MNTRRSTECLAAAFLALCAAITVMYLIFGYGVYLDSDMASELILADHLAGSFSPVSASWHYSTEVLLLNTQLIFAPLMALFGSSWQLVRTLGCIILLAVLAASCIYAAVSFGSSRAHAFFFAGLNICVCSPLYAQNVIIGAYYIPHAVLGMLLWGGFARWQRRSSPVKTVWLAALSAAMGFSSVRYLLSVILPVACAALWQYLFPVDARTRRDHLKAAFAAGLAAAGAAGYLLSCRLLPLLFHYNADHYASMGYGDWNSFSLSDQLQSMLYGLLTLLGFETPTPLMGVQGILNALILLMPAACAVVLLRRSRDDAQTESVRLCRLSLVLGFALSAVVFLLIRSVYLERYWLPLLMLGAPVMAACLTHEKDGILRAAVIALLAGTVLLTSASCIYYSAKNPQVQTDMRMEAVDLIRRMGLDKGYATFWNANIITELSDGEIDVVSLIARTEQDGSVSFHLNPWLETDEELSMDRPDAPIFLLLGTWERDGCDAFLQKTQAIHHELDGWIDLYEIPAQRLLFEAVGAL